MTLTLYPFQAEALAALEDSLSTESHVLCIAPTGSGKSLIYERICEKPAYRTLLFTPLVALARQQHRKLQELGIPVMLGAGGGGEAPPPSWSGAWIVSPEMLLFPLRKSVLNQWRPDFLVVDECHCLWDWGETFRPAFRLLPELLGNHSIKRSLWLTATLPYDARIDLRRVLARPLREIGEFNLPERLRLWVLQIPWSNRIDATLKWARARKGPGIIFVSTRESTHRLTKLLKALGKKTVAYHGGMSAEERRSIEAQVSRQIPDIVVATSAFGMGMDYPHFNDVLLWQTPPSLLSLVQTIGRVGRNRKAHARAFVLWDRSDFKFLEWTLKGSEKRRRDLCELLDFLATKECRSTWLKKHFDRINQHYPCMICDNCSSNFRHIVH